MAQLCVLRPRCGWVFASPGERSLRPALGRDRDGLARHGEKRYHHGSRFSGYFWTFRRGIRMEYRSWMCLICGWIYDEEAGLPEEGIAPGTRWEDVPINWTCPECGARKEDFEMVQI
jgi:rubredoxin